MADLRAAAQQALDILDSEFTTVDGEFCRWCDGRLGAKHGCKLEQTITALRAALAQQAKAEAERDALQSRADRAEQCAEYEAKRADKAEAEHKALLELLIRAAYMLHACCLRDEIHAAIAKDGGSNGC